MNYIGAMNVINGVTSIIGRRALSGDGEVS